MSDEGRRLDDAVQALVRKSRISAISTAVIAVGLGLGFAFLSYEVYEKRQEYDAVKGQVDGLTAQEADLEQQIAAKKQELATATAAAAQNSVASFKAQLTAAANVATPEARVALDNVIERAQIAQRASGAGRLVYLQYDDPAAKPAMQQIQAALGAQKFVAPGIEFEDQRHFDPRTPNMVKYFHAEDAGIAQTIARLADGVLARSCPGIAPVSVPAAPVAVADPAQATQLEVWIGTSCGASPRSPIVSPGLIRRVVTPQPVKPAPAPPR
jgi:hypothetical protein